MAFIQCDISPLPQTFDDRYNLPAFMFGIRLSPRILLLFTYLQQINIYHISLFLVFFDRIEYLQRHLRDYGVSAGEAADAAEKGSVGHRQNSLCCA